MQNRSELIEFLTENIARQRKILRWLQEEPCPPPRVSLAGELARLEHFKARLREVQNDVSTTRH